jgi:hypothetical protein
VLGSFVLTLDDNVCGQMGDSDCGTGLVDMLTAGAAGPVGIDPQVFSVDLNINIIVKFWEDKD